MKIINKKGISLIVLVVTMIIILILASAVIVSLTNSNISGNAREIAFKSDISGMKDELFAYVTNLEAHGKSKEDISLEKENIKEAIPSINEKYMNILKVENGEILYSGTDKDEKKWAKEIGILVSDSFKENSVNSSNNIEINENASENFKNLRIYGNSDKDETTAKVQDVGDYVEDKNDEMYGKYKIAINVSREYSKENLFNYIEPIDFSYEDITSAKADENGWFDITVDNTSGKSTIYKNCWTKPNLLLKTNTDYYLYVEIAEKSGTLEMISTSDQASTSSQFTSEMLWGSGTIHTKSNFSNSTSMLRTYVTCPAGKQCHIKFRIAVYEIENNKKDFQYTFEPYYSKNANIYLSAPLRKLNEDADYIDFGNEEVIRNIGVRNNSNSVTDIGNEYYKLSTPEKEKINEMPKLELYKGINRISVRTKLVPSKITVISNENE